MSVLCNSAASLICQDVRSFPFILIDTSFACVSAVCVHDKLKRHYISNEKWHGHVWRLFITNRNGRLKIIYIHIHIFICVWIMYNLLCASVLSVVCLYNNSLPFPTHWVSGFCDRRHALFKLYFANPQFRVMFVFTWHISCKTFCVLLCSLWSLQAFHPVKYVYLSVALFCGFLFTQHTFTSWICMLEGQKQPAERD